MEHIRETVQKECLKSLLGTDRGTAAISMGVGKTRIGLLHMKEKIQKGKKYFLVVAPKKSIFESWKQEAHKAGIPEVLDHITFSTYRSLDKQHDLYDVVYLDECHNLLPTHEPFLKRHQYGVIGLTGTPPRYKTSDKYKIIDKYCPIVYSYSVQDAVTDNILNDYRIIIHPVELGSLKDQRIDTPNGGKFFTSEQDHYQFWTRKVEQAGMSFNRAALQKASIMRMQALRKFTSKEKYVKWLLKLIPDKCIVFCNTKEQADRVCDHSYHSGNPLSKENLELFGSGAIERLSCVEQLSEGVNISNLRYGVIMHSFGNEKKLSQRLGRMLRLFPTEIAYIHILVYANTVDEHWVDQAVKDFDQDKVIYFDKKVYAGS
jgi:superfamily II DNA or RNA helicase